MSSGSVPRNAKATPRRSLATRCVERRARAAGAGHRRARAAVCNRARHHCLRLFADPQRDRSGAADASARRKGARLALPAVMARGKSLAFRAWSPGDRLMLRAARHSRAVAGGRRAHPRHHAGAAGGVRSRRPSHRLWRRTLRLHPGAFAQDESRIAIGLAFAVQEIEAVPALPHDVALDYVLTETQAFDFRSS